MGFAKNQLTESFPASGDLSSSQYYLVELNSSKQVGAVDVQGDAPLGVLQNKPAAAGRSALVCFAGVSKVVAGAAVSVGDLIMSNGSGQAITATTGEYACGMALEAATASGQQIACVIGLPGYTV